ncbi:Nose resistant to fluoxetine protein 6 [Acromyrmex echinatior]|uniref:Nose resistant to fluoxetine protein 6 n=1 Tax=Acromyrmex echinatior TaxID=103372 RepID=F4WS60_ACREC|nr:Nose resistant to fluoxetine protein 6 [Acromyrmex echinatior]
MNKAPFELAKRYILVLNNTRYRDPQDEFPPFQLNYFVAYIRHNSTLQYHINMLTEDLITLGLCLPASCSTNNISFILKRIFRDRVLLINDLYSVDLNLIQVKNLKDDHQWLLSGAIPFICFALVLTFVMMISGTIYDIFIYQIYLKTETVSKLTPAYIMMIGLAQLSSAWYDKNSQFYVEERPHETCAKYWWRNVLYIHNLFGYKTMCLSWSWYLSNDMQFYIIGLALLILSTVYFYVAVVILSTILIASVILSGYISYIYEYVPTLDELYRLLDVLYYPPWIRIGPYIIGMITGYVTRRFNKKIALKRNIVILCWTLGAACNILVLFGLYKKQISVLSAAIYVALNRTVWAIGIAWIVIMCFTEHGDIVKKLLSCKIWIPLSRLTYCAYLLNPFIIHSIRSHSETSAHFELLSIVSTRTIKTPTSTN